MSDINWYRRQMDTFGMWRMWKFGKEIDWYNASNLSAFLKRMRKHRGKSNQRIRRNLVAAVLIKSRLKYKYQVQDWSEAKKMYDDYMAMDGAIKSITDVVTHMNAGKDVYVTKFRNEAPVKGDRRGSYFINGYGMREHKQVLKCVEIRKHEEDGRFWYIRLESPDDKERYNTSLDENSMTCHRYSTQKEINDYKACRVTIVALKRELDFHQKKKEELYSKINKLDLIYSDSKTSEEVG